MPSGIPALPADLLRKPSPKPKLYDARAAADKEARRLVRIAYAAGNKAPFSLSRLVELKLSLKVIRAVCRPAASGAAS